MLYKALAFRTENSAFSSLFNIAKGGRGRSRQGVPRLLTDPVVLPNSFPAKIALTQVRMQPLANLALCSAQIGSC